MLHYDRIDVSEGIDVSKTIASKECIICLYYYSFEKGFKFQTNVCNECHDVLMMSMNLNDIAVLNIRNFGYLILIKGISESEAVYLLRNID